MPRKIQLVRAAGYALIVLGAVSLLADQYGNFGSLSHMAFTTLSLAVAWLGVKLTDYKTMEFPLSPAGRTFDVIFKRVMVVTVIAWSLLSIIQALRTIF